MAKRQEFETRVTPDRDAFINPWNHRGWIAYLTNLLPRFQYIRFVGYPSLKDTKNTRIENLYVPLDLSQRHVSADQAEEAERVAVQDLLAEHGRIVVLGDPGSGKSTLVAYLTTMLASRRPNEVTAALGPLIPLPFTLRDYHMDKGTTFEDLLDRFCREPFWPTELGREDLHAILGNGQALILLDGLDEVGNDDVRETVRRAFASSIKRFRGCRWLLTSRIVGYDRVRFDDAMVASSTALEQYGELLGTANFPPPELESHSPDTFADSLGHQIEQSSGRIILRLAKCFYLVPFSDRQIGQFAANWNSEREMDRVRAGEEAAEFVRAIRANGYTHRLARTPNLLTMMALIYRVRARLPNGRAMLYDEIVDAYLQTIQESKKLQLPPYPLPQMRRWLAHVAFQMQLRRAESAEQREQRSGGEQEILVEERQVREWIVQAMRLGGQSAAEGNATAFVDYLARRSGLLLPRGVDEQGRDRFAFMHLSFQEYFAACHIEQQITGPRWLQRGSDHPPRNADELSGYADRTAWRETLFFLAERLAQHPTWPEELAAVLFGEDFQQLGKPEEESPDDRVVLLATLAVDPYSGYSDPMRRRAIKAACIRWELELQAAPVTFFPRLPAPLIALFASDDVLQSQVWVEMQREFAQHEWRKLSPRGVSAADFTPLAGLTGLQTLDLSVSAISDLTPLTRLTGLRTLDLGGTGVSDLSPLARLTGLKTLGLSGTAVSDLTPLENLTGLQALSLGGTAVSDLTPLAGLTGLEQLYLFRTAPDLTPLAGLPRLQSLLLDITAVSVEEIEAFQAARRMRGLPEVGLVRATLG